MLTTNASALIAQEVPYEIPLSPWRKQLVESGAVRFRLYDPESDPRPFPGKTDSKLVVRWRFDFKYSIRNENKKLALQIIPYVRTINPEFSHVIELPRDEEDIESIHHTAAHEFDHVRIASDPRIFMLCETLIRGVKKMNRNLPVGTVVDNESVRKLVEVEFQERQVAVMNLTQKHHQLLDQVSSHGRRPIPGESEFFQSCFTRERLVEMEFPYLAEVLKLLSSPGYQNAPTIHERDVLGTVVE